MLVTPQKDGSLSIKEPEKTAGFDMGNCSLFVKTNGRGDVNLVYFARGAHAGKWHLQIKVNGELISFTDARAIGRLWQLYHFSATETITASVFIDEKSPVVFERIEVVAKGGKQLSIEASLEFNVIAPPPPKGEIKALRAKYIPRLPRYSHLWGKGWGRHLCTPAPGSLTALKNYGLEASGPVTWKFIVSQPFTKSSVKKKDAELIYNLEVPAGEKCILDLALSESGLLEPKEIKEKADLALHDANKYAAWLSEQVKTDDPLLKSLYTSGLNAAFSMFKELPGGFKGLVAGPDYRYPPRIYFRDGYWTAQVLLGTRPDMVREHLVHLSAGVHPDGKCPSGIFAAHLLREWHAPANCDADWLHDHFDSPSYFILLLNDYLKASNDWDLLDVVPDLLNPGLKWPKMTVGQKAHAAIEYLISRDRDGDGLIEKPYAANDWADNIYRSTWVSYDQALFIAALRAYADFCEKITEGGRSERFNAEADKAFKAMMDILWDEKLGYLVNYERPGFTEKNLSADTMVALYFGLLDEEHIKKVINAVGKYLIASENHEQPYGDYGLLCAYPPYSRSVDLFSKSASPYWYHNGADWPYLDGIVASTLLQRRDPRGFHVLTRWWQYGLQQGWLTPVEYYSPAFPVGGMLQGWSSMPAATLQRHFIEAQEQMHENAA